MRIWTTLPYHAPTKPSNACSMSSSGPSLLVHRPLGSCRAACFGAPARAYMATFSKPGVSETSAQGS
jgi:hypothetical protein